MTQIYQSFYLGLILQPAHTAGRTGDEAHQIPELKSPVRAPRATSDCVLTPEERKRYVAEVVEQFRGDLKHYEWLIANG